MLDDATPLFAKASSVPRAGVLLAVPSLVASGLLSVARKIYGSIGLAFYGLRTTLVAYVLLALLRIPRPETLKEYAPNDLGRIVGLDRMPEVKTLRRKLRWHSPRNSAEIHEKADRFLQGHVRSSDISSRKTRFVTSRITFLLKEKRRTQLTGQSVPIVSLHQEL